MDYETVLDSTLPLTVEQICSGDWDGRGFNSLGAVMAGIFESGSSPGYFLCHAVATTGCVETTKPVAACAVGAQMDSLLQQIGFKSSDLVWTPGKPLAVRQAEMHAVRARRRDREIVYFLRAGDFIKIGKTTDDTGNRVASLQTGCPFPIEVLATIRGGRRREARLHKTFAALRAHGEWFHASPMLLAFIARLSNREDAQ